MNRQTHSLIASVLSPDNDKLYVRFNSRFAADWRTHQSEGDLQCCHRF